MCLLQRQICIHKLLILQFEFIISIVTSRRRDELQLSSQSDETYDTSEFVDYVYKIALLNPPLTKIIDIYNICKVMKSSGKELSAIKDNNNSSSISLMSLQYRKYAIHYHNLRKSTFSEIEDCISQENSLKQQNQGLSLPYIFSFLHKIRKNDSSYSLEQKQYTEILKEIVEMFQLEISRILKDQNSQYHRISEENCRILKYTNRVSDFTEPYCSPQRLIKFEILGLFIQKNYEYEQCEAFPISKLIPFKIIEDITSISLTKSYVNSYRPKWIDSFHFIDQQSKEQYFVMLINIICLVLLKRKLSLNGKCSDFDENKAISIGTSKPKKRYIFKNCDQFKYKFCEIAVFSPGSLDIQKRRSSIRKHISRKIKEIFQLQQSANPSQQLRAMMLQYNLNYRSLSQWINRQSDEKYITQAEIKATLEKYQWILNINDSLLLQFKSNTKKKVKARDILSSQNCIGESLCRIALQRLNTYAVVLSIQNILMAKVDRQPSLYIRRLNYSYEYYYQIHHKDLSSPSSPEKKEKKQTIFSIVLGFLREINVFTFKFDQQLTQYGYIEHIIAFFKSEQDLYTNIVLSELDFERIGLVQVSLKRIIESFVTSFNSFVKFEGSPINFFHHLLVHSYVDKCLRQTPFESKEEFSLLLSASILRIIKIINYNAQNNDTKHNAQYERFQEQLLEQPSNDELYEESCKMFFENSQNFTSYCPKFDSGKIKEKVERILKRRQLMTAEELQSINWRGRQSFHRKGPQCQYYIFKERNIFKKIQQKTYNPFIIPLSKDSFSFKLQVEDISACLLKIFKKDWPFLTSQQISKEMQDLVYFKKKKNTGMNEIKSLIRGITRTLLIYQAYFNEYFLSEKATSEIREKYSNHLWFLSQTYKSETFNINRLYPEQIEIFYFKLLKDLSLFPITFKIISGKLAFQSYLRTQLSQIFSNKDQQSQVNQVKVQSDQ